jgi:hypothetical protein
MFVKEILYDNSKKILISCCCMFYSVGRSTFVVHTVIRFFTSCCTVRALGKRRGINVNESETQVDCIIRGFKL